MPRKAKKKQYFTQLTENAIIRHNKETRPHMRERIYNEHIRFAFENFLMNEFSSEESAVLSIFPHVVLSCFSLSNFASWK